MGIRWTRFNIDPLGLTYFAKRPLDRLPWMRPASNNWLDDYFNTEISHEQLFIEDNLAGFPSNLGFFGDSTVREDAPRLLTKYRAMSKWSDDEITRGAVKNVGDPREYKLFGNNY